MKHFCLFIILSLFVVSCRNVQDKVGIDPDGQLVLHFEAQSTSTFFSDRIFGRIEITPLETADNCLIGNEPIKLISDQHHYFIQDYQNLVVFRFDRAGKFINSIGSRGTGPGEYLDILDVDIDPDTQVVEILAPTNKIMRYDYNGTFLAIQNYDVSLLLSFIKKGSNYWFYTHQLTGDDRLMKISENGTVMLKFLPSKTDWKIPIGNWFFEQSGNTITFKEMLSHTVYNITDNGPVETTVLNFGKYAIPESFYKLDLTDALLNELNNKYYAMILKYLENEQFVYLFFCLGGFDDLPKGYYHWIVNKKTRNSVMQQFLPDNPTYAMIKEAKILTGDNELIFMADAQLLKACTYPFFSNADSIKDSLEEDANPVIIRLKINDF